MSCNAGRCTLALAAFSVGLLFRPHAVLIAAVVPISHRVLASSASPIALTTQDGESTPTLITCPHPCWHCAPVSAYFVMTGWGLGG